MLLKNFSRLGNGQKSVPGVVSVEIQGLRNSITGYSFVQLSVNYPIILLCRVKSENFRKLIEKKKTNRL